MSNPFYTNNGPFEISEILKLLNSNSKIDKNVMIKDIHDLINAENNSVTFFHSKKYQDLAKKTKASFCLTTESLKDYLPKSCTPIIVENVLVSTSIVTHKFYPNSIEDEYDNTVIEISNSEFAKIVNAGTNVLVGKNVKIGKNCIIGHNSIIEKNVQIGSNCKIGSNTIIRNSIIKDNVKILDNCVIGKHGFGFFPIKNKNLRYPHIGIVIINENSEIGLCYH